MSIRQGNNIIASTGVNGLSLLDFKWSDHKINDLNWILSSDEWYSGITYKKIYNHLIHDWETARDSSHQGMSDTIAGITIFYDLADDGHKLVISSYPENITAAEQIYEATGISWYYILDTTNKQFKLPRTKYAFNSGSLNDVGNYISAGLPNITGRFGCDIPDYHALSATGAFSGIQITPLPSAGGLTVVPRVGNINSSNTLYGFDINASRSSSIYGNSSTVQPPATKMLLYFYADQFTDGGSGKDLTDSTKNIAKWSTNITNCITEIPQDIKLELNTSTHTLTLKAGSKVYIPNGVGVFDEVIIQNDLSYTIGWGNVQFFVYLAPNNNLFIREVMYAESGSTSTLTTQWRSWYDTTNNIIKWTDDYGSTWQSSLSLPLALITCNSDYITSIDQVFNGFGYIGSTRFALPGIKWLSPNGRNPDGTLNNIERTNKSVLTETLNLYNNKNTVCVIGTGSLWTSGSYIESETEPSGTYIIWYKPSENILRDKAEGDWNINKYITVYGFFDNINGKVESLRTKTAFRSLDWNDKNIVSGWGLPSKKYIDLTFGSSGSTYTAPANGYFNINVQASGDNCHISISVDDTYFSDMHDQTNNWMGNIYPVKKGSVMTVAYRNLTVRYFRFIYAEGEI